MMTRVTYILFVVFTLSGCGFLDQDLALSDEEFARSLDGIGLSGIGTSGCGGGFFSYSSRHGIHASAASGAPEPIGEEIINMDGDEFFISGEDASEWIAVELPTPSAFQQVAESVRVERAKSIQARRSQEQEEPGADAPSG